MITPRDRMKLELTDQCSDGLQYIGHGEISTDAHAVSNTEWDEELTPVQLIFSQPSIRFKYRMIFTPDLWIVMKHIV